MQKIPVLRGFTVCAPDKNHNMGSAFFSACLAFGMHNQALAGRANFLLPRVVKKDHFPVEGEGGRWGWKGESSQAAGSPCPRCRRASALPPPPLSAALGTWD